jgi:hypothetical protein
MVKKSIVSKPKGNLLKEIDAAIALLTRARALAAADGASPKAAKQVPTEKKTKRVLSADARKAIATAQRKRWAKVRRQKKQAERAALAK